MAAHNIQRDYYEVLHVSRDAPVEIIRGSYRTMMQKLKHHPDLGGDTATAALINEAYAVLSNIDRRAEYDAELSAFAEFTSEEPQLAESAQAEPPPEPTNGSGQPEPPPEPVKPRPTRRILDPNKECLFCEAKHEHGKVVDEDAVCADCSSPLFASVNSRLETECNRAVVRVDQNREVTYFTRWPQPTGFKGQTEDISLHGMRLITTGSLEKGQRIKIISNLLEAVAIVMHCERRPAMWRSQYATGVSFEALRLIKTVGGFVSARA